MLSTYDVPSHLPTDKERLAGSADFRSEAPRLGALGTMEDTPGPGTYETATSSTSKPSHSKKGGRAQNTGGLVISSKTAPSVPDQLVQRSEIVKEKLEEEHEKYPEGGRPVPERERLRHATDFHRSKVTRGLPIVAGAGQTPGPGTYEILANKEKEETEVTQSFQFKSKTLLPYQRNQRPAAAGPGPGEYYEATINPKPKWVLDRFDFGSKAARLARGPGVNAEAEKIPGPGAYKPEAHGVKTGSSYSTAPPNQHNNKAGQQGAGTGAAIQNFMSANNPRKKYVGVHNPAVIMALSEMEGVPLSAFSSSDVRSCHKQPFSEQAPPPGTYYSDMTKLYGSITSRVEGKAHIGKLGVFGSRAERFPAGKIDDRGAGGASAEEEDGAPGSPRAQNKSSLDAGESSMFRSTSLRFDTGDEFVRKKPTRPPKAKLMSGPPESGGGGAEPGETVGGSSASGQQRRRRHQGPPPGAYDPKLDPSYRNPFRPPKTDHFSFGSSAERNQPNNELLGKPGPGNYTPQFHGQMADAVKSRKGQQAATSKSLRPTKVANNVGPGSYEVSKGLLKKSYNTTLNKRFC
eukprot:g15713.t1